MFSVASLWELVIKRALGRPDFTVQPAVLRRALLDGGWQELSIEAHHALAVTSCRRCIGIRSIACCWPRPVPMVCY